MFVCVYGGEQEAHRDMAATAKVCRRNDRYENAELGSADFINQSMCDEVIVSSGVSESAKAEPEQKEETLPWIRSGHER